MTEPGQPTQSVDPYQILQVSPSAEQEVLHAAFRALAMKYHPDRDSSARAARRMMELNQAYAMVREPVLRVQYDKSRRVARVPFDAALVPPMTGHATPPPQARRTNGSSATNTSTKLDSGRYAVHAGRGAPSRKAGLSPSRAAVPSGRFAKRDFTYDTGIR